MLEQLKQFRNWLQRDDDLVLRVLYGIVTLLFIIPGIFGIIYYPLVSKATVAEGGFGIFLICLYTFIIGFLLVIAFATLGGAISPPETKWNKLAEKRLGNFFGDCLSGTSNSDELLVVFLLFLLIVPVIGIFAVPVTALLRIVDVRGYPSPQK